mmetsp:Transcript_142712/g.362376  ORF Transcript_142712/g.362376 Transcript_142712/m.362376 type:complete len:385 (+) Transcript_142712:971-2125(+)
MAFGVIPVDPELQSSLGVVHGRNGDPEAEDRERTGEGLQRHEHGHAASSEILQQRQHPHGAADAHGAHQPEAPQIRQVDVIMLRVGEQEACLKQLRENQESVEDVEHPARTPEVVLPVGGQVDGDFEDEEAKKKHLAGDEGPRGGVECVPRHVVRLHNNHHRVDSDQDQHHRFEPRAEDDAREAGGRLVREQGFHRATLGASRVVAELVAELLLAGVMQGALGALCDAGGHRWEGRVVSLDERQHRRRQPHRGQAPLQEGRIHLRGLREVGHLLPSGGQRVRLRLQLPRHGARVICRSGASGTAALWLVAVALGGGGAAAGQGGLVHLGRLLTEAPEDLLLVSGSMKHPKLPVGCMTPMVLQRVALFWKQNLGCLLSKPVDVLS